MLLGCANVAVVHSRSNNVYRKARPRLGVAASDFALMDGPLDHSVR
jgi:hypothetical protein